MDRTRLTGRLAELGHAPAAAASGVPLLVPESAEQAADLLGECTRQGWRVRLQGAGSRGRPAPEHDLVVSARALTGFDIYEPDDLTVGARAGTTHRAAATLLAAQQQFFPLDPPAAPDATLGGSLGSGEAGPLRAGYGTPRDLTLGLTLVTGDGRILRLGGQVVKNVAGYDLVRLVVGSRGTLGFITRLHVRLRSLPPSDLTLVADLDDWQAAASLTLPLRDAVGPVALELLTPETPGGPWRIALRLHGSLETTTAAVVAVHRLLPAARIYESGAASGFWTAVAAPEAAAPIRIRCAALPAALPGLLAVASSMLNSRSDNGLHAWRGAAHAAEGVLRLWTSEPVQAGGEDLSAALAELATGVTSVGGTCICERGPEAIRELLPGWPPASRLLELERELRLRFDPGSILVGD